MTSRRPIRIPIKTLTEHPLALALPAAAYGALCRLVHHFTLTDGQPLPDSLAEIERISRASRHTWKVHGADILTVFNAWAIEAKMARDRQEMCREAGRIAGLRSAAARRRKARAVGDDGSDIQSPLARTYPRCLTVGFEPAEGETAAPVRRIWRA